MLSPGPTLVGVCYYLIRQVLSTAKEGCSLDLSIREVAPPGGAAIVCPEPA